MAVDGTMSAENVKASLEKYMYDNFVTANNLVVHWEGAKDIELGTVDEWVQPRALYADPEFMGYVSTTKRGCNRPIMLNINLFVRKDSTNNLHRLAELRDIVADYFDIGTEIPLKNYRVDSASLDTMIVREHMTDTQVPTGDQLYFQWTYTPVLMLVQRWIA